MGFNTKECAWKHISVKVLNRTIVGITGFEVSKSVEKEYLHAAGDEPIDIQSGNKTYPGNLKLLKYEVDQMNEAAIAAGFSDITEVPHEAIVITVLYKKTANSEQQTVTCAGVAFQELKFGSDQNSKKTEITIPFLSMKTIFA